MVSHICSMGTHFQPYKKSSYTKSYRQRATSTPVQNYCVFNKMYRTATGIRVHSSNLLFITEADTLRIALTVLAHNFSRIFYELNRLGQTGNMANKFECKLLIVRTIGHKIFQLLPE